MNKKITIAIDGFSSTGKSTIAKQLANYLGYIYVDTGAMYRTVTLFAMQHHFVGLDFIHQEKLISELKNIKISFIFNKDVGFAEVYLNDVNVEKKIRSLEVSNLVSKVSAISKVREKLVLEQQEMGLHKGIVMDGRDIGTVVFPNAELKIFMTASAETRAKRRYDELIEKGDTVNYEEIYKNVVDRDQMDTTRKDSPLVKADDAIEIDNSNLTKQEQFEIILKLVQEKL
ncbi:Cytidylate kinase [Polaribacter huanghezhanensis]|uniref:(d)CMP kinase n=1 Tax=Polaribacter huanghezhanensis TaxID=1354726 RepID=UPI0026472D62|nr:(d)CMP kinase [Polaribacter huanghezhanensis]WKD86337.1 Cytidylate kinase [Polaribacter huanghezhanensis]